MKCIASLVAAGVGLCFGLSASAQYVGVLQSAETMDRGTFKLMLAPVMAFGKNGADDQFGVALRGGYGFTERFDAEAKLGFFEHGTLVGADGEFWILRNPEPDTGVDFSVAVGLHKLIGKDEYLDTVGFELTPEISGHVQKNIELCGALDVSFESIQDAPRGADDSFTIVHLVPGVECRLSDAADLVGEIGIGLNDDSFTYAGVGVAFYLR